jgi:hypothetical protein
MRASNAAPYPFDVLICVRDMTCVDTSDESGS